MASRGCNPCRNPCTNSNTYAPSNKAGLRVNGRQKQPVKKPSWVNCGPCITPTSASKRYELIEDPVALEAYLRKCGKCGKWVQCAKCRECGKFELVGRCDTCEEDPRKDKIPTAAISEEVLQQCKTCGRFGTSGRCGSCCQFSPCTVCESGDNKCSQCGVCTRCGLSNQCGSSGQCVSCGQCDCSGQCVSCGQCSCSGQCVSCGKYGCSGQCVSCGQCGYSGQCVSCGQCSPWKQCVQGEQYSIAASSMPSGQFGPCLIKCSYCSPNKQYNQFGYCNQCAAVPRCAPGCQFSPYAPCVPYYGPCDPPVSVDYGLHDQYNQCRISPGLSFLACPAVYLPHPANAMQAACTPPNPYLTCGTNTSFSTDFPSAPEVPPSPCNTLPGNNHNACQSPNPLNGFNKPQSQNPPVITIYAQRTYLDASGSFQ